MMPDSKIRIEGNRLTVTTGDVETVCRSTVEDAASQIAIGHSIADQLRQRIAELEAEIQTNGRTTMPTASSPIQPRPHELARLRELKLGETMLIVRPVVPPWKIRSACDYRWMEGSDHPEIYGAGGVWKALPLPYAPGDVLEVQEEWQIADVDGFGDAYGIVYRADEPDAVCEWPEVPEEWQQKFGIVLDDREFWRPAESMPPWAVRHRLIIQSVGCKPVRELTAEAVLLWLGKTSQDFDHANAHQWWREEVTQEAIDLWHAPYPDAVWGRAWAWLYSVTKGE